MFCGFNCDLCFASVAALMYVILGCKCRLILQWICVVRYIISGYIQFTPSPLAKQSKTCTEHTASVLGYVKYTATHKKRQLNPGKNEPIITDQNECVKTWKLFPHYWSFVKRMHWSLADSAPKYKRIRALVLFVRYLNKLLNNQSSCKWFVAAYVHAMTL